MKLSSRITCGVLLLVLIVPISLVYSASIWCQPNDPQNGCNAIGKVITFYVPHNAPNCARSIEGCIATSRPGLDGQRIPVCLDDVRLRGAKYVTLASDSSNYGKYFNLGTITYQSAEDDQKHTVQNVVGYVHDTGGAFRGRPDKIDVCTTICRKCTSDAQAGRYANGVGYTPNGQGLPDYNSGSTFANSGWYNTLAGMQGQQAPGGASASPFGNMSPIPISSQIMQELNNATSTGQGTPGPAAIGILVQPKSVSAGKNIYVSWTSVSTASCKVFFTGQEYAAGKEGTKTFQTATSDVGTLTFTLQCVDGAGKQYETSSSAKVI